jgi:hypothetical protein
MLSYTLSKPIDGNRLLQDIQNLIQKESESGDSMVLIVKVQKVSYESTSHILKLEYKSDQVLE